MSAPRALRMRGRCAYRSNSATRTSRTFPGGLNDCLDGVRYVLSHQEELEITSQVVLTGGSGGGNLSIATSMLAKKNGVDGIRGVYANCPYISGTTGNTASWKEFDGYTLESEACLNMMYAYTANEEDDKSILAWPGKATVDDLKGLPPTVISVGERCICTLRLI